MFLCPNAKINIGLRVGNTRPDGYHNIETVFFPIPRLTDELIIEESAEPTRLIIEGIPVDCPTDNNLVMRVYRAMRERYNIGNVTIRLKKRIPFGAGLGGGSSDAAFTAKGLNELFHLGLSQDELARIVAPLGADCPFFVYNRPMFAQGIGDKLTPLDLDLSDYDIQLVKPADVSVSTAAAYREVKTETLDGSLVRNVLLPVAQWRNTVFNAFEQSVFPHYPAIAQAKEQFYSNGAVYASMTGTGAAVFALFEKEKN